MYPYTAINLKESKSNSIKDFLSIVDVYGLSHMIMVTNSENSSYMRLAKMPRGPTLTFKVGNYALAADIYERNSGAEKPAKALTRDFNNIPLVIMNGFNNENIPDEYKEPMKVAGMMIQSFFPPLNLNEIQLKKCKRVVLFNLVSEDREEPVIEFRHYDIDIEKHAAKKTIANILNRKKTDLSKYENIADYILQQSGYTSCSDNEDPNLGTVDVIPDASANAKSTLESEKDNRVKVKLVEIGPRLRWSLTKIEEGFLKGNVTFHAHMKKSRKEIQETMQQLKEKRKIKKERKKIQDQNVQRKQEEIDAKMTDEERFEKRKGKYRF